MVNYIPGFSNQKGAVLVVGVMVLGVMLGSAALALDLGHLYTLKTRLQNATDAAALSAAKDISLNRTLTQAEATVNYTLKTNFELPGNELLGDGFNAGNLNVVVRFSDTRTGTYRLLSDPNVKGPFVRVYAELPSVKTWFANVLGIDTFNVNGSAVAGPSAPLGNICNVFPVTVCKNGQSATAPYWGYDPSVSLDLVTKHSIGPGNFNFIRLNTSKGADDLMLGLAGGYDQCVDADGDIDTETGNNTGKVISGVNSRFEECSKLKPEPGCDQTLADGTPRFKPDLVSDTGTPTNPLMYSDYKDKYNNSDWDNPAPTGAPYRRTVIIPIVDCTTPISGTSDDVPLAGFACIFLTGKAGKSGPDLYIPAQFIDSGACDAKGYPGAGNQNSGVDYRRIVLHDDPFEPST